MYVVGLDAMAMKSHAKFLCGILGSLKRVNTSDKNIDEEEEEEDGDAKEMEEESLLLSATSTIDALISLSRNASLSGRGDICVSIVALLMRISLFSQDTSETPSISSPKKQKKKKSSSTSLDTRWSDTYGVEMIESIRLVEASLPLNDKIVTVATQRLLVMLADFGHQSIDDLNTNTDGNEEKGTETKLSVLDTALYCLSYLLDTGKLELDRDLGSEEELAPYPLQEDLVTVLNMSTLLSSSSSSASSSSFKLLTCLYALLGNAIFQVLSSVQGSDAEIPVSTIPQLVKVCHMLLADAYPDHFDKDAAVSSDEHDEDVDGHPPSALSLLFDSSMELLSVPVHHSVKGIRDAIKKTWYIVASLAKTSNSSKNETCIEIDLDMIDEVLTAVIGDDGDDDDDDDDDAENEGESVEEDEDEDEEVECKLENGIDDDDEDSVSEEDIKLNSDGLMNVLEADMDDEEETTMLLQHSENADAALVQMIEMRRQGRKHGLMKAKQRELLIRTRAIDILEVSKRVCMSVCAYKCLFEWCSLAPSLFVFDVYT